LHRFRHEHLPKPAIGGIGRAHRADGAWYARAGRVPARMAMRPMDEGDGDRTRGGKPCRRPNARRADARSAYDAAHFRDLTASLLSTWPPSRRRMKYLIRPGVVMFASTVMRRPTRSTKR
jgi:hypothetical protein